MGSEDGISRPGLAFGPFRLMVAERLLERDGIPVRLGSRALDILIILVEQAGEVVAKNDLLSRAWPNLTVDESSLRFHVAALRKALGDGRDGARYITNVPGRGYCFVAPTVHQGGDRETSAEHDQPSTLPRRPSSMIGRDGVVLRISKQLANKRFVTIQGPGGIGKTTVAVAVSHAQAEPFDGAVHFLDLGPIKDASLVASVLASTLGLLVQSSDPTDAIINALRDRRILLVFDSCEHVIEAAASLAERIYQDAPLVSILATSRELLRVEGEHVFELPPLDRPPRYRDLAATQILSFPATQLFVERARAGGYQLAFTDADAGTVAEICQKLDGIPLAIELAAGRVSAHGLHETAALLDSRLRLLWRGRRTALPRHQTLSATLDWSYDLITNAERAVLRRLAIFAGPFTLQAAQAVVPDTDLDEVQVVEAFEQLVAKSLVSTLVDRTTTAYRLLDTMRAYVLEKIAGSDEFERLAMRHAAHVTNQLEQMNADRPMLGRAERHDGRAQLLGDTRAALEWSFSRRGNVGVAVRLAAAASRLFLEESLLDECRRWTEQALSVLDETARGTRCEMELQADLGHSLMFTEGNGSKVRAALERGLEIAHELGDRPNEFRMLNRLHMLYRRTGEFDHLLPIAQRASTLATEIGGPAENASTLLFAVSHQLVGNQIEALRDLETSFQVSQSAPPIGPDHFAYIGDVRICLPLTLWLRGFPAQALEIARRLTSRTPASNVVSFFIGLSWGGIVLKATGDWATAEAIADQLIALSSRYSLAPYQAVGYGFKGEALIEGDDVDQGIALLETAIARLQAYQYGLYTSGFCRAQAAGLAVAGRLPQAQAVIDDTISRVQSNGGSFDLPELLRTRGEIQASAGNERDAEASYAASNALAERQGALSWRLRTDLSLARLRTRQGRQHEAQGPLAETYARFDEGHATADLTTARQLLDELERPTR